MVSDFLCQRFPDEVIQWGCRSWRLQSGYVPEVIAEAFALSPEGARQILMHEWRSNEDRCEVLAAFVVRATKKQLPQWFISNASEDASILDPFCLSETWSPRSVRALQAIAEQCEDVPLAREEWLPDFVQRIVNTNLGDRVISKVIDSAIIEHSHGRIGDDQMLRVLELQPIHAALEQVAPARIQQLLLSHTDKTAWRTAWRTTWRTTSILPPILFGRVVSDKLIVNFNRSSQRHWTQSVAEDWSRIVERARDELSQDASLRLCVNSTMLCLSNPTLPLERVVRSAFPSVYRAVCDNRSPYITDLMFGYFDWDHAKKLRKDVIDAFVSSQWPPEGLAIIAWRSGILRKIVHRLQRRRVSENYIRRMLSGLGSIDSDEARVVRAEINSIIVDPEFFEPWD